MDIRISRSFTGQCCCFRWDFDHEYELWEVLLDHVDCEHPDVRDELDREGRRLARGNNGAGYWDSDASDGWSQAGHSFRRAHRIMALKMKVQGHLGVG